MNVCESWATLFHNLWDHRPNIDSCSWAETVTAFSGIVAGIPYSSHAGYFLTSQGDFLLKEELFQSWRVSKG